jgi:hypothetical protein
MSPTKPASSVLVFRPKLTHATRTLASPLAVAVRSSILTTENAIGVPVAPLRFTAELVSELGRLADQVPVLRPQLTEAVVIVCQGMFFRSIYLSIYLCIYLWSHRSTHLVIRLSSCVCVSHSHPTSP